MEKKIPALIDNKSVMDDFIYDDIFKDNYLKTPKHNGTTTCNVIGYYDGKLLEARWSSGTNRLCLAFISTNENYVDYMTELPKLKAYFDEMSRSEESDVSIETMNSGNWLICDFYIK